MGNYACAFSQSESGKYVEWIIKFNKRHTCTIRNRVTGV